MDKTSTLLILGGIAAYIIYNEYNIENIYINEPEKEEKIIEPEIKELNKFEKIKNFIYDKKGIIIGFIVVSIYGGIRAYFYYKKKNSYISFEETFAHRNKTVKNLRDENIKLTDISDTKYITRRYNANLPYYPRNDNN